MQALHLFVAALAVGLASASPSSINERRSPALVARDGKFVMNPRVSFANHAVYTFNNGFPSDALEIDRYSGGPNVQHDPSLVTVQGGYLQLRVPGGQTAKPYRGAQVLTKIGNIKYASVRTVAILSETPGVCNGNFFYLNDRQEIDIEWLSDPQSQSNQGTRKLWFTNQDANGDGQSTYNAVTPPSDATSTEHEYRVDWTEGLVQFYVDGALRWQTNSDVPTSPGRWIWNNWANGDPGWSAGPPAKDAVFKIRKIDMYYNTA